MTGGIFIKRVVLISSLSFVFFLGKVKSESPLTDEEVKFFETLDKGIDILETAISKLDNKVIPGDVVFKLHDTFGFPFDLTADIAREKGLKIE